MYQTNEQVWLGLGKNATEGIGAPGSIGPMSALLFGGQVLPFLLLPAVPWLSAGNLIALLAALPAFAADASEVEKQRAEIRKNSQQILNQHRGLIDLLEARQIARGEY